MAALPPLAKPDPTLEAMNAVIVAEASLEKPRPYLGMSAIGEDCEARLWFSFRFATKAGNFDAKTLRNFEDGHLSEDLMAARLRKVPGLTLHTVDQNGKQFGFSGIGGHFRGHIDGALLGLYQAPKTWHCWENKCSEKGPSELEKAKAAVGEKDALEKWHPVYFAQAQMYMHHTEMDRHYLTVQSPGGRMPESSVRTNYQPEVAKRLLAKAERVIFSAEPGPKLSADPAFFKCKMCPASAVCHGQQLAEVSCRTCLHATPEKDGDGRWSCAKRAIPSLSLADQQAACCDHLFIPALVTYGAVDDASEQEGWVSYVAPDGFRFRNGPRAVGSYSSRELNALSVAALRSEELQAIRNGSLPDAQWVPREDFKAVA